jgi:hypothetical protein
MQAQKDKVLEIKGQLKLFYPKGYALAVAERLRRKGFRVSVSKIYNFFNNQDVGNAKRILKAAAELLKEAKDNKQ